MKRRVAVVVLLWMGVSSPAWAEGDISQVWEAVARKDARALRMAVSSVNCNVTRGSDGHSPLTLAASLGSFECVRELLWAGAAAERSNGVGKTAKQYLKPGASGFTGLNLLLRSHAFGQRLGGTKPKAGVPHRVLVIDGFVDPTHPDYASRYWINSAERNGRTGVDDDGNGFVDDVSGWNIADDQPQEVPQFGLNAGVSKAWLQDLMDEVRAVQNGDDPTDEIKERLEERFENPIFRQMGKRLARSGGVALNDFAYGRLVREASHGTHVAGIVFSQSRSQAELHAAAFYEFDGDKEGAEESGLRRLLENIKKSAPGMKDYPSYLKAIRDSYLAWNTGVGQRFSQYIKSVNCGVVNMSYGKNLKVFRQLADAMQEEYQENGANPESMKTYVCPIGMDLCGDLALELQVANAASFALAMAQNPDVLFVIAAGNDAENNDEILPIPAYLSRFFANVITVASVSADGALSSFSNTGVRSVQVAAEGEDIRSAFLGGVRGEMSGTSMAAPAVAGMAARVRAAFPNLSASAVRRVILASAQPNAGLSGKVGTRAVANGDRALQLAKSWEAGAHLFLDEAWDWPSTSDKAPLVKHLEPPPEKKPTPPPAPRPPPVKVAPKPKWFAGAMYAEDPRDRLTVVGGFSDNWYLSAQKGGSGPQHFILSKEWPSSWLGEYMGQGFTISCLAGDTAQWAVVLDKTAGITDQKLVGYSFDQTQIKANMDAGYRIRTAAGYGDKWVVVMQLGTGYGNQRYTLPGAFDQKRMAWIKARWDEGMRITSVAGESGPNDQNSWLVVMSANSGLGAQSYKGPGPWPADWVKEKWTEGYTITALTGHGTDKWLVVMSKKPGTVDSGYSGRTSDPKDWIEGKWRQPQTITRFENP